MAKEIPSELKEFKEKLNGKLSTISSTTGTITSKISALASASTSAASAIASNYQSSTEVNAAVSKLSSAAEFMNIIQSDITSTVNSAVSKANTVISKVNELEKILSDIEVQENRIATEKKKEEPNNSTISDANSKISELNTKFDTTVEEAKSELSALKALDKTISKGSNNTPGTTGTGTDTNKSEEEGGGSVLQTYTDYLNKLKYGQLIKDTYNSSAGKITYYLYVPDGAEKISGLPVMLYLHGGSAHGTGMGSLTGYGLYKYIASKQVNPQGIVILPHITDFESTQGKQCKQATLEITNYKVKKYNANPKKVSIAGHSYGAIMGYQLISENPGMFSALAAISGWDKVSSDCKNVKVWAFHGTKDGGHGPGSRTTYKGAQSAVNQINSMGGQATLTSLNGMGHSHCQDKVLEQTFTSPDGKNETYLDWIMRQTRA